MTIAHSYGQTSAAGLRHRRRQFRVGKADEDDGHTADQETQHCADAAGAFDPATGQRHPAPADHRAECERQHFLASYDA